MAQTTAAQLPRSPRRRLTHRPATPRGAMLRLAALAGAMMRVAEEGRPSTWEVDPSDADVTSVLEHLVPIRSRRALAHSYSRESRRLLAGPVDRSAAGEQVDAIDLAYATRWLQLEDPALIR